MGYSKLESEAELMTIERNKTPSLMWPENGAIELDKLKFRYAANYPYVLKSVSIAIKPDEKVEYWFYIFNTDSLLYMQVGIVGRTGAGKSSLLAALFRLAEPEGVFKIDGIQITDIGLHDLRKKLSIIPQVMSCEYYSEINVCIIQDPVLFSGTVRYNLDPFNEHTDNNLWDALEEV